MVEQYLRRLNMLLLKNTSLKDPKEEKSGMFLLLLFASFLLLKIHSMYFQPSSHP